ncbi:hydantoinase/oxoprolinase family protein [Sphaerimonospora sp. CA-214678]|uniref:hydantoinase/oxoprolinase family protein n=1 Tax=Sphaerimonospora sp. CA-214678 TaxID=3240029 RepID=UPI003D8E765D
MTTVIGVDVGGTFTDLVLHDAATGDIRVAKRPTTPRAPELGVLAAVDAAVPAELLARCAHFVHGTTVGLNALLESTGPRRTGAVVGLVTTAGFRDVLEIRRGDRDDPYDLFWTPPPPLVPRRLRAEVAERVAADGGVVRELDPADVLRAARLFQAEGVDAVAVVLVNSYANARHELLVARSLRDAGFAGPISLSHEISGEYREYERTCTTVVDALVRHRMGPYLHNLDRELRARGFTGRLLVTRSGGGALTLDEAVARPFETILSGPVAGAVATARLAASLGVGTAIAADVGGTSFDTALIEDGRLPLLFQGEVVGLPLQSPWADVRSVGAGGGSIAYVDPGGLLRVGPRSAGADPGPACYLRGGTEPTVTDAALHLGMIPVGHISGGISLSAETAARALAPLAEPLTPPAGAAGTAGIEGVDAAAEGVIRIASAHMAQAVRGVTVERGVDPRGAAIVAFGGAGPLFGCLLADELDADTVIVPPNAGNFSAVGLVQADIVRSAARTLVRPLDGETLPMIERLADALFERMAADDAVREVDLDLRHRGQEHTLTIPMRPGRDDVADITARFSDAYHRTFGHRLPDPLEVVTVRATTRVVLDADRPPVPAQATGDTARGATRLWSFRRRAWTDAPVLRRAAVDGPLEGPALVLEPTATTYVDVGFTAEAHPSGCLMIKRKDRR